jgi:ComF family protein
MNMVTRASAAILNALLPPQCLMCAQVVESPGALCAACFTRFTFAAPPHCDVCGVPFELPADHGLACAACLRERPAYGQARSVFVYDDESRGLVLKLKHGDRTDLAVHLARWMQRAGAELLARCDVIVPVPLHRWRLFMRSYNQAALLANALHRLTEKPVAVDALVRVKATPSQGGLDRAARQHNVARVFAVKRPARIAGKHILLIDDVLTTGATADACCNTLRAAGAASVDLLVLARVPGPRA